MVKVEKKANFIQQISTQNNIRLKGYEHGVMTKHINKNGIYYDSSNCVSEKVFDHNTFFESCYTIDWEMDVVPILDNLNFSQNKIVSCIITINQQRCKQSFKMNNILNSNDIVSTYLEMIISIRTKDSILNLKRDIYLCNADKQTLMSSLSKEFENIKRAYYNHLSYSLLDVNANNYDLILPSGIGGVYIHEAMGHCLEADLFFKKESLFNGRLGKQITKNKITIVDSCSKDDIIHYDISDDGTFTEAVTLINDGYLENVMTDEYTSNKYKIKDTGNGRVSDCFKTPIPRMRNTYLQNGEADPKEIIKSTKRGIIATDIMGGNVTTENGNFVFNVAHGLVINEGQIIGICNPFLFDGNILSTFDCMDAIGNDLSFSFATCGKQGQLVPVSYGQPTIRISNIRRKYETVL